MDEYDLVPRVLLVHSGLHVGEVAAILEPDSRGGDRRPSRSAQDRRGRRPGGLVRPAQQRHCRRQGYFGELDHLDQLVRQPAREAIKFSLKKRHHLTAEESEHACRWHAQIISRSMAVHAICACKYEVASKASQEHEYHIEILLLPY